MAKKEKPIKELLFRDQIPMKSGDIMPQVGFQEEVLLSDANLTIIGGSRGSGKSFSLVLDPLYDCSNGNFAALFFRKELSQVEKGLYAEACKIYPFLGATMTKLKAKFPSGAVVDFDHLQSETPADLERRFKGLSIPAFYFDELDHFKFDTVKRVIESNRNSHGIRNRIIASCNPNPSSWLRTFLDWWISADGFIDPERDKKTRYFYIYGTEVTDIIWGSTKDEVLDKASYYIDGAWDDSFLESGLTKYDLIKSVKFIKGDVSENKILLKNDPNYIGSIAQGGAESIARNFKGNWNILSDGEEMVKRHEMDRMFDEYRPPLTDDHRYLTIDVALLGLDNFVAVLWNGMHIEDIFVKEKLDSEQAVEFVSSLMNEYGVRESNVGYDSIGNGQALSCFKRAVPIYAQAQPIGKEIAYDNLKSQLMYTFGKYLIEAKITCSIKAAEKLFNYGKGQKRQKLSFKEILQNERRALMIAESPGKTKMKNKKEMKAMLGGQSPDFLEAVAYRMVFELDKKQSKGIRGLGYL